MYLSNFDGMEVTSNVEIIKYRTSKMIEKRLVAATEPLKICCFFFFFNFRVIVKMMNFVILK